MIDKWKKNFFYNGAKKGKGELCHGIKKTIIFS